MPPQQWREQGDTMTPARTHICGRLDEGNTSEVLLSDSILNLNTGGVIGEGLGDMSIYWTERAWGLPTLATARLVAPIDALTTLSGYVQTVCVFILTPK